MKFKNIRHKWRSGAQNNDAVDKQPNPCQMENMGTSHAEKH